MPVIVKGVARKSGAVREPTYRLVSAVQDATDRRVLPAASATVLG
jgi:hypothetical protein